MISIGFVASRFDGGLLMLHIGIITLLLPQSFCTSMISSSFLARASLQRSRIRWRRGSGCMGSGVSHAIPTGTLNLIRSVTRSTSFSIATFARSWQNSEWMNPVQLPCEWWCSIKLKARQKSLRSDHIPIDDHMSHLCDDPHSVWYPICHQRL